MDGATPAGRPVRVRSRLVVAVAVVAAAVGAAGTPAIVSASSQLADTQDLVTRAELTKDAVSLAHSLSDERDEVTSYIAAGRPQGQGLGDKAESRSGRVDRQIAELRAEAPASLRKDLDTISGVRRTSLTGKGTALEAHRAYTKAIGELHRLAERLADRIPPRAGAGARALADLDRAVEQAAATRGLLLAGLSVPRGTTPALDPVTGLPRTDAQSPTTGVRDELTAAAQQSRVREQAALADFERAATATDTAKLHSTVTGPEVDRAERYLASLTDQPTLTPSELRYGRTAVNAALSARVEQLRSVENTLATDRIERLSQLRDDDVTALELRIALVGAVLLLAIGAATAVARTLTRPLAVLRLGSARLAEAEQPGTEEPIKFTGRNDEFATVVRSVNALRAHAAKLQERLSVLEGDRKHLIGQREQLADEREELRAELTEATARLARTRDGIGSTFVQLALRTLALVERQLAVIEQLEEREQDPDRLATLFKLDHFATVMRRHSENLLVLAGAEHRHSHPGPVPLIDVLRAAVSEIERYERVRIAALPPHAHIAGFAADDISHLVAEIMENATSFSPPDAQVEVSGWLLESGEVMLSVQDEGIGMTDERLAELNARLRELEADPAAVHERGEASAEDAGLGLGLYVVARLAARHGARVQLREQKQGGVAAVVVLPKAILAAAPAAAVAAQRTAPVPGGAPAVHLPGSEAEANSNVLDGRSDRTDHSGGTEEQVPSADPLIGAAEEAIRAAEESPETTLELAVPEPELEHAPVPDPEPSPDLAPAPEPSPDLAPAPEPSPDPVTDPEPAPVLDEPEAARVPEQLERTPQAPADATDDEPAPAAAETHERADDGESDPTDVRPPKWERVTDKGLPKRTPKLAAPTPAPAARNRPVDAEALRRRLGGFHQGAQAGRRDVAAELADEPGADHAAARTTTDARTTSRTTEDDRIDVDGNSNRGDSAEEARS